MLIELQVWPAAGIDRIIRQTSESAAYWHREGVEAPWTAAEPSAQAESLRNSQEEPTGDDPEAELPVGWPHHHLLRSLGSAGQCIGSIDPEFAEHLTAADQATLRAIACWAGLGWAGEQTLTIARLRDLPGIGSGRSGTRMSHRRHHSAAEGHRVCERTLVATRLRCRATSGSLWAGWGGVAS